MEQKNTNKHTQSNHEHHHHRKRKHHEEDWATMFKRRSLAAIEINKKIRKYLYLALWIIAIIMFLMVVLLYSTD